jgi:hypothetical protein
MVWKTWRFNPVRLLTGVSDLDVCVKSERFHLQEIAGIRPARPLRLRLRPAMEQANFPQGLIGFQARAFPVGESSGKFR